MTSIFEGQPPKTRPFPSNKNSRAIWVPGIYYRLSGNMFHSWRSSTYPPPGPRTPPEIAGLIKGLLTIGFP